MMTSLHTDARRRASNAGVRGPPRGRVMYTTGWTRCHAAHALEQAETSLLSFWGRESVCPHSPHTPTPPTHPTPPGLCVFDSTKPLHCLAFEDQRAFWTVAPCFTAVRKVAWAPSKEFFFLSFFLYQSPRRLCQHCEELKGIYLNPNIYGQKKKKKKSWIMQQSQVRMQTLPYRRRKGTWDLWVNQLYFFFPSP